MCDLRLERQYNPLNRYDQKTINSNCINTEQFNTLKSSKKGHELY